MANTFELISSVTVGSGGAATIDFTSIPATYTDLAVYYSLKDSSTIDNYINTTLKMNGTTANYSSRMVYGVNSTTVGSATGGSSAMDFAAYAVGSLVTTPTFSNGSIYIPNYAGSTNKSVSVDVVTENNGTGCVTVLTAGLWSNTAAINRLTLTAVSSYVQYSTAYLYGVKNA